MKSIHLLATALLVAALGAVAGPSIRADNARAQTSGPTIFLVRHAERADGGSGIATKATDPNLSDAGHQRAASLAAILKDAQIQSIFVTEYKRTQETAAPLAKAIGVTPIVIPGNDLPALIARLQQLAGNALVVGHSNTVPQLVKGLGVPEAVTIADNQYDDLFLITNQRLVRLHYRP